MAKFKANLKIKETVGQIKKLILIHSEKEIRKRLLLRTTKMEEAIKDLVIQTLKSSDTYKLMIGHKMRGHFGFESGTEVARMNAVIRAIAESVEVRLQQPTITQNKIKDLLTVKLIKRDMSDVYQMGEANITTEKGENLPWLEWLLEKGGEILVEEYDVRFFTDKGRSKVALMVKKNGGFWSVPMEVRGTVNNNWITRELKTTEFRRKVIAVAQSVINQ